MAMIIIFNHLSKLFNEFKINNLLTTQFLKVHFVNFTIVIIKHLQNFLIMKMIFSTQIFSK